MADKAVKTTVVLSDLKQIPNIGELKMSFAKADGGTKEMSIAEYLKMMVELSQCGMPSSLVLTFTTQNN